MIVRRGENGNTQPLQGHYFMSDERRFIMSFCVYVHINKANGKRYVGITSTNVNRRWANGNGYKSNVLFYRAIQKYGWDEFKHVILFDGLDKESAYTKEIELIAEWDLTNPKVGYNIDKGGNGSNRITEATRKKLSDGTRRYFEEHPEAKEANAERLRNMPHSVKALRKYQKEHPEWSSEHSKWLIQYWSEHPEIVAESAEKKRRLYIEHPEKRISKSKQTSQYFREHPEARRHNAIKTHEYYQNPEVKKWKSEERKKFFAEHPEKKTTKAVVQLSLDGEFIAEFESARIADKTTGVSYKQISQVVTGRQKKAGGYIWRYKK